MIAGRRPVVGLDIGSRRTCAIIAEPQANASGDGVDILGVGTAETEGVCGTTVTNLEAATESVRVAIQAAEYMAGREVERTYIGVGGGHVEIQRSTGVVAISGDEVESSDLERVEVVGRAVSLEPHSELIHALCHEYVVDGRRGIQDPVGMRGTRLESEVCLVTARADACRNLRSAVDRAGYRPEEVVLESLASSLAVLGQAERDAGAALLDIGADTTDLLVFCGNRISHMASVPWGSDTISRDIAKGLGVPQEEANRLKERHGAALKSKVDPEEKLRVSGPSAGSERRVSRGLLVHIIEQRLDEILGLAYDELEDAGLRSRLGSGVVLTGSGASLPDSVELARSVFNMPVRLGEPGSRLAGMADAVRRPGFATGVGLAMYGSQRVGRRTGGGMGRLANRVGEWLRDFF